MTRPSFSTEEKIEELPGPTNDVEAILFQLHDNWPSYRGFAVPTILSELVSDLRKRPAPNIEEVDDE